MRIALTALVALSLLTFAEPGLAAVERGTHRHDVLTGTPSADRLLGRGGSDKLRGKPGNDKLRGGRGGDRLSGGRGRDRLLGGPGRSAQSARHLAPTADRQRQPRASDIRPRGN